MNDRINQLYWEMDFRESEPVSLEREENLKRIAHELVVALSPKKPERNLNCDAVNDCKAPCEECLFNTKNGE